MVKKLLCTLSLGLLFGAGASAQVFTLSPNDTLEETTTGQGTKTSEGYINTLDMSGYINNVSSVAQPFRWKLLSDSTEHPVGWLLTGICDNVQCRSPYSEFYFHVEQETFTVNPNDKSLMEARIYVPVASANGTGVFRVQIRAIDQSDTSVTVQTDTMVYIVNKTPTGISSINVTDKRVAVYPNPATNNLMVYTERNLNAANITIVNIAGVQQTVKSVEKGKEVANLDIRSLAIGLYMVRVTDDKGALITTRKFAKK